MVYPVANTRPRFVPLKPIGTMGQVVSFDPKVEFKPDVKVQAPIQIELGGLPLSIGLFLGSGLAFLVRSQLSPGAPQTVALLAGAGLAVGGITNLLAPKAQAAAIPTPSSAIPTTTAPTGPSGAPIAAPPGLEASDKYAFDQITGRVSYPAETETIDIWPTSSTYPLTLQLHNAASVPATFYIEIVADETPYPIGSAKRTTYPLQVTIGPGQNRDIPVNMPITAWDWMTGSVDVNLNVYKRRTPDEQPVRIASRYFIVD